MPQKSKPARLATERADRISSSEQRDVFDNGQSTTKRQALSELTVYKVDRFLMVEAVRP